MKFWSLNTKMDRTIKENWIQALRSKKYKQGFTFLRTADNDFCVLGVLCDIVDPDGWERTFNNFHELYFHRNGLVSYPPAKILEKAGLSNGCVDEIYYLNDSKRMDFDALADYIEVNYP